MMADGNQELQLIEAELLRGSGFENGKDRIYEFAKTNPTSSEFATFLKDEYGIGGHSGIAKDVSMVHYDAKGIKFDWTNDSGEQHKVDLSWVKVATHIQNLIDEGRYHSSQQLKPKDEQISLLGKKQEVANVRKPIAPKVLDKREKLIPLYERAMDSLKSDWVNYLNFVSNFNRHKFINQVMIFSQSENSQMVADEKTWNKLGRYVSFNVEYITTIIKKVI